jgi:hypothetical protein
MGNWKITGLGVVALSLAASAAAAEEPFTANKGQLGAQLMYGVDLEEGDLNPYGLGLAPQAGYTLAPGIYLGGRVDYFFGDTEEAAAFPPPGSRECVPLPSRKSTSISSPKLEASSKSPAACCSAQIAGSEQLRFGRHPWFSAARGLGGPPVRTPGTHAL